MTKLIWSVLLESQIEVLSERRALIKIKPSEDVGAAKAPGGAQLEPPPKGFNHGGTSGRSYQQAPEEMESHKCQPDSQIMGQERPQDIFDPDTTSSQRGAKVPAPQAPTVCKRLAKRLAKKRCHITLSQPKDQLKDRSSSQEEQQVQVDHRHEVCQPVHHLSQVSIQGLETSATDDSARGLYDINRLDRWLSPCQDTPKEQGASGIHLEGPELHIQHAAF